MFYFYCELFRLRFIMLNRNILYYYHLLSVFSTFIYRILLLSIAFYFCLSHSTLILILLLILFFPLNITNCVTVFFTVIIFYLCFLLFFSVFHTYQYLYYLDIKDDLACILLFMLFELNVINCVIFYILQPT